jgi:hypothetical protein
MRIGLKAPFDVVGADGTVDMSFGELLQDQHRGSLALDGLMTQARGTIFYSGKPLPLLASFAPTGRLNWAATTIAPGPESVLMERGGRRWVENPGPSASFSLSADEQGRLFSLTRRWDRRGPIIDVYAQRDGSYLVSLDLPRDVAWTSVAARDNVLWAASLKGVYRWPISDLAAEAKSTTARLQGSCFFGFWRDSEMASPGELEGN